MLIRSWNLYHGNTSPPRRDSYLEEMVRLVVADRPDAVLLQELPSWSLPRLADWSGMAAVADVAQRARLGPVPIPAELGRRITALDPGLLRSAFAGQGNAILLGAALQVTAHEVLVLNPLGFRRAQARALGLKSVARLAWAKERRICQVVRVERASTPFLIANLHATSSPGDPRIPAAEVRRTVGFLERLAGPETSIVLGGDLNLENGEAALAGFSAPGPWIDHVLVRGARASAPRTWPDERRRRGGMLLSDHPPVEVEIE